MQRGLFRSGIYAAEVGDVQSEFAAAKSQVATETLGAEGQVLNQLETLDAKMGNAQAQKEMRFMHAEYEARLAAAGI